MFRGFSGFELSVILSVFSPAVRELHEDVKVVCEERPAGVHNSLALLRHENYAFLPTGERREIASVQFGDWLMPSRGTNCLLPLLFQKNCAT